MIRQGDVFLIRCPTAPAAKPEPAPRDPRGIVLAEGESSGHYHRVFGRGAKLFTFRGSTDRLLVVGRAGAEVRVVGGESGGEPRHLPVALTPGRWIVRIQRGWTSAMRSERVAD
jgi:hypothetical protein